MTGLAGEQSSVTGLCTCSARGGTGSSGVHLVAALAKRLGRPLVLVPAHLDDADEAVDELRGFGLEASGFPALEVLPLATRSCPRSIAESTPLNIWSAEPLFKDEQKTWYGSCMQKNMAANAGVKAGALRSARAKTPGAQPAHLHADPHGQQQPNAAERGKQIKSQRWEAWQVVLLNEQVRLDLPGVVEGDQIRLVSQDSMGP